MAAGGYNCPLFAGEAENRPKLRLPDQPAGYFCGWTRWASRKHEHFRREDCAALDRIDYDVAVDQRHEGTFQGPLDRPRVPLGDLPSLRARRSEGREWDYGNARLAQCLHDMPVELRGPVPNLFKASPEWRPSPC